jgi:hypothetical protein
MDIMELAKDITVALLKRPDIPIDGKSGYDKIAMQAVGLYEEVKKALQPDNPKGEKIKVKSY